MTKKKKLKKIKMAVFLESLVSHKIASAISKASRRQYHLKIVFKNFVKMLGKIILSEIMKKDRFIIILHFSILHKYRNIRDDLKKNYFANLTKINTPITNSFLAKEIITLCKCRFAYKF